MGAVETVNIIVIFPKRILAIVSIDYQLSDPTHEFVVVRPATGKHISSEIVVDSNSDVRACPVFTKELRSKPVLTNPYTFLFLETNGMV